MSQVSLEEVEKIADLARLKLTGKEATYFQGELSSVLGFFRKLDSLEITFEQGFPADVLSSPTSERADEVLSSLSCDEVMAGAPKRSGSSFLVPKILE